MSNQGGYLIRNLGASVHVCRPGETDPAFIVPTVPEALALIDIDRHQEESNISCPGCVALSCECRP